jgi:hypothetical protein
VGGGEVLDGGLWWSLVMSWTLVLLVRVHRAVIWGQWSIALRQKEGSEGRQDVGQKRVDDQDQSHCSMHKMA